MKHLDIICFLFGGTNNNGYKKICLILFGFGTNLMKNNEFESPLIQIIIEILPNFYGLDLTHQKYKISVIST